MAPTFPARRSPGARARLLGALLGIALTCAYPLRAQESQQALAARALFDAGRQLMSEGRIPEACVKFEESQALRAGIGTEFNLAECYEKMGRSASAWSLYLRVAAETKAQGQLEREQIARGRADALAPQLAKLIVTVSAPPPELELRLDGEILPSAAWGLATPIDPGAHALEARAEGYEPWRGNIEIVAGPSEVSVDVPPLTAVAPAASAPTEALLAADAAAAAAPAEDVTPARARRAAYIVGGVGGAGVLLGTLFGLRAAGKNAEAAEICKGRETLCLPAEIEQHGQLTKDARSARTAALVSLGIGAVGLGIAGFWLLDTGADASAGESGETQVQAAWSRSEFEISVSRAF